MITSIKIDNITVGDGFAPLIMAGPCSVESYDVTLGIAQELKKSGVKVFRAGAYKPRTSPFEFQGLGAEGLEILAEIKKQTGLKIITEVLDVRDIDRVLHVADILQIGSRNMHHTPLLKELAQIKKPVLLKRAFSATLEEWLMAAQYIAIGNNQIILCERGIRTFSQHSRNTLDLNIIPILTQKSPWPVVVDPSHGTGLRASVRAMARASLAAGAHGLLIEAHTQPELSISDAKQTIDLHELGLLMTDVNNMSPFLPQFSGTQC